MLTPLKSLKIGPFASKNHQEMENFENLLCGRIGYQLVLLVEHTNKANILSHVEISLLYFNLLVPQDV